MHSFKKAHAGLFTLNKSPFWTSVLWLRNSSAPRNLTQKWGRSSDMMAMYHTRTATVGDLEITIFPNPLLDCNNSLTGNRHGSVSSVGKLWSSVVHYFFWKSPNNQLKCFRYGQDRKEALVTNWYCIFVLYFAFSLHKLYITILFFLNPFSYKCQRTYHSGKGYPISIQENNSKRKPVWHKALSIWTCLQAVKWRGNLSRIYFCIEWS